METRAHHVMIGLFSVIVVVGAMLFGLWLAKSSVDSAFQDYEVIFNEAVSGLSQGSAVQYSGIKVGDAVIGFLPMAEDGASAEYALAPADILASAPSSIPLADAAALPCVGLTAWQALFDHAGLTSGQRVLINGAGGAVGFSRDVQG